jgi:hypothetical protein
MIEAVRDEAIPQISSASGPTISSADREILRRLAATVAELAAQPVQQTKRDLWYRHNALEATRPLVLCFPENAWGEIITPADLACEGAIAREWEYNLRREIFWGAEMRDDRVITPDFNVPFIHTESDWGLKVMRTGGEGGTAYTWNPPLKSYDDLDELHFPEIVVDDETTSRLFELAHETLGDLLQVRLKFKWVWSDGLTNTLAELRGLGQLMYDMYDHPAELHRLMAFLRDGRMARLDFLESNALLCLDNDDMYVGSGGYGWSHELPQGDFDGHVRPRDTWGFAESQETVGISPEMFAEFVFPYQLPLLERYGLNCYGCCEPLDTRWHVVKQIPRLRRVSVSPWSDVPTMAGHLTDQYIFSWKPNPADLAMGTFDEDSIRSRLRQAFRHACNCRIETIMKDTHTIRNDPRRIVRWVQIALEEAESL